MDLNKLKRVENLEVGDHVKAWGPDLEVETARPMTDGTVEVDYATGDSLAGHGGKLTVTYGAGTVVETA